MFAAMRPRSGAAFGPCAALDIVRELLPADGIMSCDVGAHIHLIGQKWPTPAPGLQLMTNGWSAMGFGIPAAIAAKLCRPDTAVCAIVGDGGFLMTCGELAVAVRENLKIVFVLLTDNDLALIRIKQERKGNPIYGTPIRARGTVGGDNLFGVPVLSADNALDFRAALTRGFAADGPVIVEAVIDSREYDDLVLRKDRP
jgi:acetolactate synthase-1/2/3 large subunit